MFATAISRTKIADGRDLLEKRDVITREPNARSTFSLNNYGVLHVWAVLPAKPLYDRVGAMPMFEDFHLRKVTELDALKIYLTFAARRDTVRNVARIKYNQISDYADIPRNRIKRALGILNINGLVIVESYERRDGLPGAAHAIDCDICFRAGMPERQEEPTRIDARC